MSIYKVLIFCVREVQQTSPTGYTYNEEQSAYAEYQYFSTLEKAQAFTQRYSEVPLVWEALDGEYWTTKTVTFGATIYLEKDAYFDTTLLPPLPTKFAARGSYGD